MKDGGARKFTRANDSRCLAALLCNFLRVLGSGRRLHLRRSAAASKTCPDLVEEDVVFPRAEGADVLRGAPTLEEFLEARGLRDASSATISLRAPANRKPRKTGRTISPRETKRFACRLVSNLNHYGP
jgi:hypothetical protein